MVIIFEIQFFTRTQVICCCSLFIHDYFYSPSHPIAADLMKTNALSRMAVIINDKLHISAMHIQSVLELYTIPLL